MPPGTYRSRAFDGGVTFELAGLGWTNEGNESDVVSSRNGKHWFVIVGGSPRMGPADDLRAVPDPVEARAILGTTADLVVTVDEAPATIAGVPAVVFDVINNGPETDLWYYPTSDAHHTLEPGFRARILWLSIDGEVRIVSIEAPPVEFDAFDAEMQATLGSLRFG